MKIHKVIQKALLQKGIKVERYVLFNDPLAMRMRFLSTYGIDLVFDVGANDGRFAALLREKGYSGRIVSFEPMSGPYAQLVDRAALDPAWDTANVALGEADTDAVINVAANSFSSSLLGMMPAHVEAASHANYTGKEAIKVMKLDSVIHQYYRPEDRLFIKLDTQGYEQAIIAGAEESIAKIAGFQIEMSLVQLYQGESLIGEMIGLMHNLGFTLINLDPEFRDPSSGHLLQVNGIFFRTGA